MLDIVEQRAPQGFTDLVTPYTTANFLVGQMMPLPGAAPLMITFFGCDVAPGITGGLKNR